MLPLTRVFREPPSPSPRRSTGLRQRADVLPNRFEESLAMQAWCLHSTYFPTSPIPFDDSVPDSASISSVSEWPSAPYSVQASAFVPFHWLIYAGVTALSSHNGIISEEVTPSPLEFRQQQNSDDGDPSVEMLEPAQAFHEEDEASEDGDIEWRHRLALHLSNPELFPPESSCEGPQEELAGSPDSTLVGDEDDACEASGRLALWLSNPEMEMLSPERFPEELGAPPLEATEQSGDVETHQAQPQTDNLLPDDPTSYGAESSSPPYSMTPEPLIGTDRAPDVAAAVDGLKHTVADASSSTEIAISPAISGCHLKRQRSSSHNGDDDDSDRPAKLVRCHELTVPRRLACPFFKMNPVGSQQPRSCRGPGWTTVHRVKEHIYRNHTLRFACERCHVEFESAAEKDAHLLAEQRCELSQMVASREGVDTATRERIKRKVKKSKNIPEVEKWRDMYTILFPTTNPANIPSPYYEHQEDGTAHADQASESLGLTERVHFEEFLHRELPCHVRKQLETRIEEALDLDGKSLPRQLVDIVHDMQFELFEAYKAGRDAAEQTKAAPDHSGAASDVHSYQDWEEQLQGLGDALSDSGPTMQLLHPGFDFTFKEDVADSGYGEI